MSTDLIRYDNLLIGPHLIGDRVSIDRECRGRVGERSFKVPRVAAWNAKVQSPPTQANCCECGRTVDVVVHTVARLFEGGSAEPFNPEQYSVVEEMGG